VGVDGGGVRVWGEVKGGWVGGGVELGWWGVGRVGGRLEEGEGRVKRMKG